MKLKLEQTYNNICPFYESARQARTERRERNKEKKKENTLKRIKIREDCLKKAVVTKDSYIGTKEPMSWSERGIKRIGYHTFFIDRRNLSFTIRRKPSNSEISKFEQSTIDEIDAFGHLKTIGQCKIKPENLI
jgi:hypothetical protein